MPDCERKSAKLMPPMQRPGMIGGHLRALWRDRTRFLTKQAELGDVSFIRMGPQPVFFINHPDVVRDMFVVNAHKFIKGRALQRSKVLLGNGLLTNEGPGLRIGLKPMITLRPKYGMKMQLTARK